MGYIATDRLHNRHVSMAEIFFPDSVSPRSISHSWNSGQLNPWLRQGLRQSDCKRHRTPVVIASEHEAM